MANRKIYVDQYPPNPDLVLGSSDANPFPLAISNGTQVADTFAGDSGQNGVIVVGSNKVVTFSTTTAQTSPAYDVRNFASVSVQISTEGTGSTVTFQTSNDGAVWQSTSLSATDATNAGPALSTTAVKIYAGSLGAMFFRLSVTGITAGTTAATIQFSAIARPQNSIAGLVNISGGQTGAGTAISGNPVRTGVKAVTSNTVVTNGQTADVIGTLEGAQITKPYSIPNADWTYAAAAGGIINTTAVPLAAAAGAGLRNYLTGVSIQNASATIATEVTLLDGATVIWRGYLGVGSLLNSAVGLAFPTPLRTSANAALSVQCATTASQIYVNAQGYIAS